MDKIDDVNKDESPLKAEKSSKINGEILTEEHPEIEELPYESLMEKFEIDSGDENEMNLKNDTVRHLEKIVDVIELPQRIQDLCQESLDVRKNAYAPYSHFQVGCAIQTKDKIVTGCNVENASFPMCVCAEVVTVTKAVSEGYRDFSAIAIATDTRDDFCAPCGACRQVICEFNPDIPVYLVRDHDKKVQVSSLDAFLPQSFTPKRRQMEFLNKTET